MQYKKIIFPIILAAASFSPVARAGSDQQQDSTVQKFLKEAGEKAYGVSGKPPEPAIVVGNIVQEALLLVGVILFALFLYGGILWMTSGGNEERVTKAKGLIQNAFWGMVIVAGAYLISFFITERVFEAATKK